MRRTWGITLLVVCAVVAHGVAVIAIERHVTGEGLSYPVFGNDAAGYETLGQNILYHGVFSRSPEPPFISESFRTPGYPALIALSLWMSGSLLPIIVLQVLVSGGIAFLLFRLAEESGLTWGAYAVGAFALLEPAGLFLSGALLTETMYTFLFLAALLFIVRRNMSPVRAGIVLGLATLIRPVGLVLLVPLALWMGITSDQKRLRAVALFVLSWFIIVLPWTLRNGYVFGVYAVSDVVERKLLLYDAPIYAGEQSGKDTKTMLEDVRARIAASTGKEPRELTLADRDAMREIIDSYIDSWPRFIFSSVIHALPFFGANEIGSITEELRISNHQTTSLSAAIFARDTEEIVKAVRERKWFLLEYIFWGACVLLAFTGIVRTLWLRDRRGAVRLLFAVILLLSALGTGVVATYRLRYPVSGLLFILALGAVVKKEESERKDTWTRVDDLLRLFRFRKIKAHIPEGAVLVDLGCGHEAYMLRHLKGHISEGWGFDKDVAVTDEGDVHIRSFTLAETIEREEASADVVTLCAALEHFPDDVAIIREARRVLKHNGAVIVTVPSIFAMPILEVLAFLRIISPEEIRDHKRYYTPAILRKVCLDAGFREDEITTRYWQFGVNCFARAVRKDGASRGQGQEL